MCSYVQQLSRATMKLVQKSAKRRRSKQQQQRKQQEKIIKSKKKIAKVKRRRIKTLSFSSTKNQQNA